MDTVEELNGTYFYDGSSNLSAGELFFWITIDETLDHFGISDIAAVTGIYLGSNSVTVAGKFAGATPGTSVASIYSRKLFRDRMLPVRLPTWVGFPPNVKRIMTQRLGTFVGRTIPVVGWVILAVDVSVIMFKSVNKYNTIVHPSDRLW
ncbi:MULTISPECIES: STM2901 family protein [Enterobacterales]|uniref:STM2901 family protein n=1 Tax=Enterobacterales TaxID=91347 RepID=UPI002ED95E7F